MAWRHHFYDHLGERQEVAATEWAPFVVRFLDSTSWSYSITIGGDFAGFTGVKILI